MRNVLITGAGRGLGLEFARQCLQRGDTVFATARYPDRSKNLRDLQSAHPEHLFPIALELSDLNSIEACRKAVSAKADSLDLLINNAGISASSAESGGLAAVSRLGQLDNAKLVHMFQINAIAPLIFTQQFLNLLKSAKSARVVSITSGQASLTDKTSGGNYGYCASKAALNMFMRTLAFDILPFGIVSIVISPGWVKTDMGGASAPLTAQHSVESMLRHIDALREQDAGRFFNWDGEELPW